MAWPLPWATAELNLARMYSTGHGVPRDDVEAAKWLRRGADQGRVVAQTVLAAMYIAGRGVVKSDTEAVTWERKAADQGYAAAQSMLGSAYEEGKGAPQSDAEAARWIYTSINRKRDGLEVVALFEQAVVFVRTNGTTRRFIPTRSRLCPPLRCSAAWRATCSGTSRFATAESTRSTSSGRP